MDELRQGMTYRISPGVYISSHNPGPSSFLQIGLCYFSCGIGDHLVDSSLWYQKWMIWHFNSNDIYFVKSGYHHAIQLKLNLDPGIPESSFKPSSHLWNTIWKLKTLQNSKLLVEGV